MLILLAALAAFGVLLPLLPIGDPLAVSLNERFFPPASPGHWLGTDDLGRDVLSRLLLGLSTTLLVSVGATIAAFLIGTVVGGVAGYFPDSLFDRAVNWLINLILSLPLLLVIAAVLSVTGPGLTNAYVVLALLMWVAPARVVRAEVTRRRQLGYVLAARALGVPRSAILFRKLLPRAARPALAMTYSYLPEVIGLEAGLSFLGLGVRPPAPAVGRMILDGLPYLHLAWWLAIVPAAALSAILLVINLTAHRRGGSGQWRQG